MNTNTVTLTINEFDSTPDIKKGYNYLVLLHNEDVAKVFYNAYGEYILNGQDIADQIKIIYTPEFDKLQPIMYDNE